MNPRVFVIEPNTRYDLSGAKSYGDVVYISKVVLNPFQSGTTLRTIRANLEELQFDPHKDYFCLAGYMLSVSLALSVLTAKHAEITVLMYDARNAAYTDRLINVLREDHDSTALASARL